MRILIAGVIFSAVVAAGLFAVATDTQAGANPTYAGVDLDPSGNACGALGSTEQTRTIPLNTPTAIDVVVKGVPVGPASEGDNGGIYGTGFELTWSPIARLRVTASSGGANNVLHLCSGSGYVPLEVFDAVPDTDGSHRVDTVDLSGNEESGDGRLATITIECLTNGTVNLNFTDTSTGGGNEIGVLADSGAITYNPDVEGTGVVTCGEGGTPSPTTAAPTTPPSSPTTAAPTTPFTITPTPSPTPTGQTPTPTPTPTGPTPTPSPTPTECPECTPTPTPSPTPTSPPGETLLMGDTDCDGDVDPVDGLKDLRFDAGLSVDQEPDCPPAGEDVLVNGVMRPWGETDCDGDLDPVDGLKVLRFDAGLPVDQNEPPDCPDVGTPVTVVHEGH